MIIPDSHLRVLEHLAAYRYLTPQQFLRLGVSDSRQWLWRVLRQLESGERPLIRKIEYGVHPAAGKLPKVNYLAKSGAEELADGLGRDPRAIFYPKQHTNLFRNDYFHRTATIDFQIELARYVRSVGALPWFHAYFHKQGSNRAAVPANRLQAVTKVKLQRFSIIPDGIFRLDTADGNPWLFALEVKNGADTGAALQQIEGHIEALEEGAVSSQFGFSKAHRVLFVFSEYWHGIQRLPADNPMYALMRALAERREWSEFLPFFVFSTIERLQRDFASEWYYVRPSGVIEPGRGGLFDAGG